MLRQSSVGFGSLPLAGLLSEERKSKKPAETTRALTRRGPLLPKAKRVLLFHMHGGLSQIDMLDWQASSNETTVNHSLSQAKCSSSQTGNLLKSPWKFRQHGQCGHAWVSASSSRSSAAWTIYASSIPCTARI
ncbi:MAG: hypothetical protein U1D30_05480 [Planctomycetota bacterium]